MKCVKNFTTGWSGDQLKPLTEKSLNKLRGTWSEVLNADDYIKPLFDIDMKIAGSKEDKIDYDKWIIPIREVMFSDMAEKVGEDRAELLCASSSGWNEEKGSHYVSLHITFPRLKILFKNMPQLVEELGYTDEQVYSPEENVEINWDIDRAIYGKERQCIRLINQDKPLKGGGRAVRKKMKHIAPNEAEKPDWDYVVSNVAPDAFELDYVAPAVKKQRSESTATTGASIEWSEHYLDQWIKDKYPNINRRTECESCVYYDFDLEKQGRFCEFKMNDSSRNHGKPDAHAVFGNYIMWNKTTGRIFVRCRCPDGTCPSSCKELVGWREEGMWEKTFKEKGEDAMIEVMNDSLAHLRFEGGQQVYITNYKSIRDIEETNKTNIHECFYDEGWEEVGPNGGIKEIDPIKLWRKNRKHLKLNRRVFDPSKPLITEDKNLNLWKGYNLCKEQCINFIEQPDYGWDRAREEWNFYKNHIEEHLCNEDLDLANYVLNWMASVLQRPGKKTEVMLVVKGPEGVGKSAVFAKDSQFQKIIAQSVEKGPFYQISETNRLFCRFNDRMKDVRLMILNEALFAGDKKTLSQLKELITDSITTTEKKFGNAINIDQFYDLISITNYQRASPFTTSSRRWQGIETGKKLSKEGKTPQEKAEISKYFKRFWSIPPQVVGYYLYTRDISEFNPPNDIVYNKFMVEQSEYGRSIVEKFVIAMADYGYVRFRGEVDYGGGLKTAWIPNFLFLVLDSKTLYACFEAYKKSIGFNDRYQEVGEQTLISQIRDILGPKLFVSKSMEKGMRGYCCVGVQAVREHLNTKYKIGESVGWENELTYASGCYKKFYNFIKIDNFSDKARVRGGTMKNKERRVFMFSTIDEAGDTEMVRLGLVKRSLYQFKREGDWVNYNKKGAMINNGKSMPNWSSWQPKQLDNCSPEEIKENKTIAKEGEFFGRPSAEDLYDSDIDEEELEKVNSEEGGDMEILLEQKEVGPQEINPLPKEHIEEQVSESEEEEEEYYEGSE